MRSSERNLFKVKDPKGKFGQGIKNKIIRVGCIKKLLQWIRKSLSDTVVNCSAPRFFGFKGCGMGSSGSRSSGCIRHNLFISNSPCDLGGTLLSDSSPVGTNRINQPYITLLLPSP